MEPRQGVDMSAHLAAPTPAHPTVRRDRLLALVDLAAGHRLTLVVAPHGYGKTALLAEWATTRTTQRVRWLTLSSAHDAPSRLAQDVCTVLQPESHPFAHRLLDRVDNGGGRLGHSFLVGLVAELDMLRPTTLILDDLDELT